MRLRIALLTALCALAAMPAAGGEAFVIEGTLQPSAAIAKATLICRATAQTVPIRFDPQTGAFRAAVPDASAWDIQLDTARGRVEGVNLKTDRTDLGLPRKAAEPLTDDDRQHFADYLDRMETFENKKRILLIEGDSGWARVLVELIRDEPTTLRVREPSMIYRVEVWDFTRQFGTWRKAFERARAVQYRALMPIVAFHKTTVVFDPRLGGFHPTRQQPAITVRYTLPDVMTSLPGHVAENR